MTDPGASAGSTVVLIDGRSGSGKTTFAARLAARSGARILHLDDLYPGWDGLAAGSRAVARALRNRGTRRYDWETGAFAEWMPLEPGRALIIEGCGALTRRNLAAACAFAVPSDPPVGRARRGATGDRDSLQDPLPPLVRTLWIDAPRDLRRARALDRDGEMFAPHWERWAAQERRHLRAHQPWRLAQETLRIG